MSALWKVIKTLPRWTLALVVAGLGGLAWLASRRRARTQPTVRPIPPLSPGDAEEKRAEIRRASDGRISEIRETVRGWMERLQ